MLVLFCVCVALIIYVYAGYPLLLRLNVFARPRSYHHRISFPSVSIIVAAHNEEAVIETKLRNLLELDYPRDLVEILVGSDGSSDGTEDLVRAFAHEGVRLISFQKQQGKTAMQNGLVATASGELLVFTDADCLLACDALKLLIENFADSRVGLVTARPRYLNEGETSTTENESLYLRYESWMRLLESERGILAMASGSCFAMRRALWRPLDRTLGDDFAFPLRVAQAGMVNWLDARAVAVTRLSQNRPGSMLRMKVRIISKDFRALLGHRALLDPLRHGAFSLGLWSHKLLRWLVPYLLLALVFANVALLGHSLFRAFFALQAAFYAIAFGGFVRRTRSLPLPWSVPASFCIVNLAALLGTLRCMAGRTSGQWTPERTEPLPPRPGPASSPFSGFK
jgi:cellulose synthase/poly-beta-1,6-N-acetylglucosamine synthase-like glycosyltransferase